MTVSDPKCYRERTMRFSKLCLLLACLLPSVAYAQYESLLHKPYSEKVSGIHAMYKDLIDVGDSTQRAHDAEEIRIFARKNKDFSLERNVDFFMTFWNSFYQNQPREVLLAQLIQQLELATLYDIDFLKARSLRALAEFYWKVEKNYELAFEQYLLLDKELLGVNAEEYPEITRDLMQIGQAYYFFQDYLAAKEYFQRAIQTSETAFSTVVINDARNTLGLCFTFVVSRPKQMAYSQPRFKLG
jgi:tetratricopeptide (TPR) repeat protein